MPDHMTPELKEHFTRALNGSGFPFQLAVARAVADTNNCHHCSVISTEHAWSNANAGTSGFIDLILEHFESGYVFVVECKRAKDAAWVFLSLAGGQQMRRTLTFWVTDKTQPHASAFGWAIGAGEPRTPQAMFCVPMRHQSNDKLPPIESIAAELVDATSAFASEDAERIAANKRRSRYISVLVTTANLQYAEAKAGDIDLATGTVSSATYSDAPFLRFHKQLSAAPLKSATRLGINVGQRIGADEERTVFVVNAAHLSDFLCSFSIDDL